MHPTSTSAASLIRRADAPLSAGRVFSGIAWSLVLFLTLLGMNVIQTLSVVLRPIHRRTFQRINRWCANTWWGFLVWTSERIWKIRPEFSGDEIPQRENALVFANHQEMPDIIALMMLAVRKGRLGDMKWFMKRALMFVPGVGWGAYFLDCLFVRRHWESDQQKIQSTFGLYYRYEIPFWLITFPEATRLTAKKLQMSQRYARRRGFAEPQRVLIPRTKGFSASVSGLRGRLDAVYDVTLAYPQGTPNLLDYLLGRCTVIRIHVKRHPIASMPIDDSALNAWLLERFVEKDRYLQQH